MKFTLILYDKVVIMENTFIWTGCKDEGVEVTFAELLLTAEYSDEGIWRQIS